MHDRAVMQILICAFKYIVLDKFNTKRKERPKPNGHDWKEKGWNSKKEKGLSRKKEMTNLKV